MPSDQTAVPPWLGSGAPGQSGPPSRVDEQVIAEYLAHIEQMLEARLDQRVEERLAAVQATRHPGRNYTGRLVGSLAIGIPLTAVSAGIAGSNNNSGAAVVAIVAVMFGIVGLNVFYTVAELIGLHMERGRHTRQP